MIFHIVTIFPESFDSYLTSSILKNARGNGFFDYKIYNLCDYSIKNTRRVDDRPFGGMPGTIITLEPLYKCISEIVNSNPHIGIIHLSPRGKKIKQHILEKFAKKPKDYIVICGHYEGIDDRIKEFFKIEEYSIGDYVLTSGELAAMVLIDGIVRLLPGVLNIESLVEESFSKKLSRKKEYPQFTRPREFLGKKVPEELLSGDPKIIQKWKNNFYN